MRGLTACLLLGLILSATSAEAAPIIGFRFGMDQHGQFGITNTSDAASISAVTISLPLTTFFDTLPAAPGASDAPFATANNQGIQTILYPPSAVVEAQSFAVIGFTGFDPGDVLTFRTDIDLFTTPDTVAGADAIGTIVSVLFSNGAILQGVVTDTSTSFTVNQQLFSFSYSATASQDLAAAEVPEPTSLAIWSLAGIGGALIWRRRSRRA